jgi:hypothetical protein
MARWGQAPNTFAAAIVAQAVQPMFLGAAPGQSSTVFQINLPVPAPPNASDNVSVSGNQSQARILLYAK